MNERPDLFSRAVRWSFNPEGRGPHLLRTLFIVIPALMFPIMVLTTGLQGHFLRRFFYSLCIGEVISLTCASFTNTVGYISSRFRIKIRYRTYILASAAGMGPGMWLAFHLVDPIWARYFHFRPEIHDLADYGVGFVIGGLILSIITLSDLWITARAEAEKLQTETLQAKLSALSAQLNPHLLFNALNTIASTIPSDPRAAEETTLKLSELYRGILTSSRRASHPLGEELELCRSYLGIEAARFGQRLRWSIDAPTELLPLEIPALLIQPLVENAVKHGISQKAEGGTIAVRVFREPPGLAIVVEDDGVGLGNSISKRGTGTGVSSCRARLELVYQGRASFEIAARADGPGTRVAIRIPEKMEVLA